MRRLRQVGPATTRVALGLFIVWQLLFLLGTNLLEIEGALRRAARERWAEDHAPDWVADKGPLGPFVRLPRQGADYWADLTGQEQSWSLFAPAVSEVIPFLAVELRWAGPPESKALLLSDNEPGDRRRFFRLGNFRLRRYESTLDPSPEGPSPLAWREAIRERVEQDGPRVLAYLRWRLASYQRRYPDLPAPAEVVLLVRLTRVPTPPGPRPWDWEDEGQVIVARWRPGLGEPPGSAPLELYDPVLEEFEWAQEP